MGSSLGGLISLYALIGQPNVFGLSVVDEPGSALARLRADAADRGGPPAEEPHPHRHGRPRVEGAVEDLRRLRDVLIGCGWQEGRDLQYVEERNAWHRESDWARRLPDALRFVWRIFASASCSVCPQVDAVDQLGRAEPLGHRRELGSMSALPAHVFERFGTSGTSNTSVASSRNRYASSRWSRSDGSQRGPAANGHVPVRHPFGNVLEVSVARQHGAGRVLAPAGDARVAVR